MQANAGAAWREAALARHPSFRRREDWPRNPSGVRRGFRGAIQGLELAGELPRFGPTTTARSRPARRPTGRQIQSGRWKWNGIAIPNLVHCRQYRRRLAGGKSDAQRDVSDPLEVDPGVNVRGRGGGRSRLAVGTIRRAGRQKAPPSSALWQRELTLQAH